ncbi:MAG TPA: hypothetical protein VF350_02610 [Candidatus Bathyarchaeia archaeon]
METDLLQKLGRKVGLLSEVLEGTSSFKATQLLPKSNLTVQEQR